MAQSYEVCHACQLRGDRLPKLVASKKEVTQYSSPFFRYYCDAHTTAPVRATNKQQPVRQTVEDKAIARINEIAKTLSPECGYGPQAIAKIADLEWSFVTTHPEVREAVQDLSDYTKERRKRYLVQRKEANAQDAAKLQILINESIRRVGAIAHKITPDRAWKSYQVCAIAGVNWDFAGRNDQVKNVIVKLVFDVNQQFYLGEAERAIAQLKEQGGGAPIGRIVKQLGVSERIIRVYPKVFERVKAYSIESGGYCNPSAKRRQRQNTFLTA